jgi:flavodoxin
VYDSVFGNTEKVALAMSKAFNAKDNVGISKASSIQQAQLKGLDVLIVGSPTRAFRPTTNITLFLKKIPGNVLKGVRVAAFDTRISLTDVTSSILHFLIKIFGYAAQPIAEKLTKKGGDLVLEPQGFMVKDTEGPLKEGELERAAAWARRIVKK